MVPPTVSAHSFILFLIQTPWCPMITSPAAEAVLKSSEVIQKYTVREKLSFQYE